MPYTRNRANWGGGLRMRETSCILVEQGRDSLECLMAGVIVTEIADVHVILWDGPATSKKGMYRPVLPEPPTWHLELLRGLGARSCALRVLHSPWKKS